MSTAKYYGLDRSEFIRFALEEDVGDGDHTSLSTIDEHKQGTASVRFKEDGIVAGIDIAHEILKSVDKHIQTELLASDGDPIGNGQVVMQVSGSIRSMLKAERLLLNCMQRMSGIATLTSQYVRAVSGTKAKILDTRKTTPNFRQFEKIAVKLGGGYNHRTGLYDMILIKDNHVDAAGGISHALNNAKEYLQKTKKKLLVEIETRSLEEVRQALESNVVTRIMLDNFDTGILAEAVKLINGRVETEASGGITLNNVRQYALSGVDFISVGAITHSYRSLDISMKISL